MTKNHSFFFFHDSVKKTNLVMPEGIVDDHYGTCLSIREHYRNEKELLIVTNFRGFFLLSQTSKDRN